MKINCVIFLKLRTMERLNKTMTEFVLEQSENKPFVQRFTDCFNYAKFISQKPELWMFIPCGSDGSPFNYSQHGTKAYYQHAVNRVLFDGFHLSDIDNYFIHLENEEFEENLTLQKSTNEFSIYTKINTLEDLIPYNLKLRNYDKAGSN